MSGTNDFDDFDGGWGSSSDNEFGSDLEDSGSFGGTDSDVDFSLNDSDSSDNTFGDVDFSLDDSDSGASDNTFGDVDFSLDDSNSDSGTSSTSADFEGSDWGNIDEVPANNGTDSDFENEKVAPIPVNPNYGYKTIGMIIAGALLVVAVILVIVSKVSITKKDISSGNTTASQNVQTDVNNSNTSSNSGTSGNSSTSGTSGNSGSSLSLKVVPDSTSVDTSGEVMESEGTVTGLKRYLQDGQVIYCVEITMGVGMGSTTVHYYCGYNIFSELGVGDKLTVSYQKVSDECFSVNTIAK